MQIFVRISCWLGIAAILAALSCSQELQNTRTVSGQAQGTTYQITYVAGSYSNFRNAFDSIFQVMDASMSTYQSGSIISRINRNDGSVLPDAHFINVFNKAMEVSDKTSGLFDVTVAPLVNAYGFGPGRKEELQPARLDSIMPCIGYRKLAIKQGRLEKTVPCLQLDFNAIAQGYTVDVLADFLNSKGINHYLIELGGEVRAKGTKQDGTPWSIGLEQPNENTTQVSVLERNIVLQNRSLATSGNYKKFYLADGKRYTHIINPLTGLPARNSLLSATVIAGDCMTADAYATSFMVMGVDKAIQFLKENPELRLQVFFIYDQNGEWKTYSSL